ncbi:MAG TPA: hypothetical protein EYO82_07300 [Gammaproteobacteria bacterium]|nr:hypothetical protein [Gammaproteobacteria bacterium]
MKYLFGFAALVVGLAVGNWFPDVDQKTDLLVHRSIVTHGPLLPIIVVGVASVMRTTPLRWVALGLAVGLAVHLSFDLFPKGWSGFALISVPGYGWTAPWFSGAWIAISTVFCTHLAIRLVKNGFDGCILIMSLVCAFGYITIGEDAFWRPVVVLTVATAVALIPAIHHAKSH